MGLIDDKALKAFEKVGDTLLKHSERWNIGQKVAAFLVCLLAGAALVSGRDNWKIAAGVTIALFGIAFLTFRRRTLESETLVLKDQKGTPRIVISGEHGIMFLDQQGTMRMLAQVSVEDQAALIHLGSSDGTGLMLQGGNTGASVIMKRPGEEPALYLKLSGADSAARIGAGDKANVCIIAARDGNTGLVFENQSQQRTAILGSYEARAHLSFFAENGSLMTKYPDDTAIKNSAVESE
jgi:hypothetical protein